MKSSVLHITFLLNRAEMHQNHIILMFHKYGTIEMPEVCILNKWSWTDFTIKRTHYVSLLLYHYLILLYDVTNQMTDANYQRCEFHLSGEEKKTHSEFNALFYFEYYPWFCFCMITAIKCISNLKDTITIMIQIYLWNMNHGSL